MKTRVLVLRTAGTNCDCETAQAFEMAGAGAERVHVNRLSEDPELLKRFHVLVIPGGFSYGDDLGAGKVLANEILTHLRPAVQQFIADGKLILGVCNGFQALVKTGLLPGLDPARQQASLTWNESGRFIDRWVHLRVPPSRCVFTAGAGPVWFLPIAHAEGRFVTPDGATLARLEAGGQIVFQYADPDGRLAGAPWNPNGSVASIAGVCDPSGRILGMMPHPERHVLGLQHPRWPRLGLRADGDGLPLFRNAVRYVESHL